MNKVIKYVGPVLGLLVSGTSFADWPSKDTVIHKCYEASSKLSNLIEEKSEGDCSGDLAVAIAYIDSTAVKLDKNRIDQAKSAIKSAQYELQDISSRRSYCAYVAPKVRPVLAEVIRISSEIDVINELAAHK